jgi:uncharacterized protein
MRAQEAVSPWVLDTRELIRRPGSMRTFSRVVTAPDAIGTDVIAIPSGQKVELEVRMESVVEGVLATGQVRSTATGVCVRCLEQVELELEVPFQELFAYADRAAHHHEVATEDDDDDEYTLDGDLMDLESLVRDAVVTALPFQPVCRPDCPGLCPHCGARLADDPDHQHDLIDPRWSALAGLAEADDDNEKRN